MIYTKLTTRGSYIYVRVKSNMYYYALLKCCAHNAETSCSKWCYARNAETLTYMVKGRNVHTCSNSELDNMWSSNTELMITATNCVVCPIMHVSEVIICQDQLEIHCFTIMSWPLSWLIMSAHCIPVQQKLDTCSIVFYIDQIDLSSWLRHPNLYRWILPLCVFSFNLYWPCLCSAFQCDVEGFFHQV